MLFVFLLVDHPAFFFHYHPCHVSTFIVDENGRYMSLILDIDRYVIRKQMERNPLTDLYWKFILSVSFDFDIAHRRKITICVRHNKMVID